MEEKILLELEKLQEEKKKIEEEKNTAFDLLAKISEQKRQVEETIEKIQFRENVNIKKTQDLEIVHEYIEQFSNNQLAAETEKKGEKDETIK